MVMRPQLPGSSHQAAVWIQSLSVAAVSGETGGGAVPDDSILTGSGPPMRSPCPADVALFCRWERVLPAYPYAEASIVTRFSSMELGLEKCDASL
jgi:hypothetical protein